MYNKHLEKKHMVIFGLNEIRECGGENEKQELNLQLQIKQAVPHFNMNPLVFGSERSPRNASI